MRILSKTLFVLGTLIALFLGLFPVGQAKMLGLPYMTFVLILVGIVVGMFNIVGTQRHHFLITTILLLVIGNSGLLMVTGSHNYLSGMMLNVLCFVGPAAIMVGCKAVHDIVTE